MVEFAGQSWRPSQRAGAVTCDAHHMTDPHPDGLGVSTCIRLALEDGGVDPDAVSAGRAGLAWGALEHRVLCCAALVLSSQA